MSFPGYEIRLYTRYCFMRLCLLRTIILYRKRGDEWNTDMI